MSSRHDCRSKTAATSIEAPSAAKVIEIIGTSDESWQVLYESRLKGTKNHYVIDGTGIGPYRGRVIECRTGIHLSFGIINEEVEQQQ